MQGSAKVGHGGEAGEAAFGAPHGRTIRETAYSSACLEVGARRRVAPTMRTGQGHTTLVSGGLGETCTRQASGRSSGEKSWHPHASRRPPPSAVHRARRLARRAAACAERATARRSAACLQQSNRQQPERSMCHGLRSEHWKEGSPSTPHPEFSDRKMAPEQSLPTPTGLPNVRVHTKARAYGTRRARAPVRVQRVRTHDQTRSHTEAKHLCRYPRNPCTRAPFAPRAPSDASPYRHTPTLVAQRTALALHKHTLVTTRRHSPHRIARALTRDVPR